METEVARRRINKIAGHFATNDDIFSSSAHLLPMNCSSSINSVIRRCDNRTYFARQASDAQACFMRPVSNEQSACNVFEAPVIRRCDNRTYFARQASDAQACFMRPVSDEQSASNVFGAPMFPRPSAPLKCSGFRKEGSCNASSEAPLFSRPARMEPVNFPNYRLMQPQLQDCKLSMPDLPKFAKPDRRIVTQEQSGLMKKLQSFKSKGVEWSPRMNVLELGSNYVVTIEIPGVCVNDIRVEVDDKNLTVMAKHPTECWKVAGCANGSITAYHRREYGGEPYQVVWPLPINVDKDIISAEFLNGLLQIIIPKL